MWTSGSRTFGRLERLLIGLVALLALGALAHSAIGSSPAKYQPTVEIVQLAVLGGGLAPAGPAGPSDEAPPPRGDAVERAYDYLRATQDRYLSAGARLLESYDGGDPVATAWVYDNALAGLAFLKSGRPEDLERARSIADFLVSAAGSDVAGRTRDAYDARSSAPRATVSQTSSGNVAWEALFLLAIARATGDRAYADAAGAQLDWVEGALREEGGPGGYLGGVGADGAPLRWRSTEQNIDLWAAFDAAGRELSQPEQAERGRHAEKFVRAMFDPSGRFFWTGTGAGPAASRDPIPLDAQSWGYLVGGEEFASGLAWVRGDLATSCLGRPCYRFSSRGQGGWYEGTAQMALALRRAGDDRNADELLASVAAAVLPSGAVPASTSAGCDTGYGWSYPASPVGHVGATAWFILASADPGGVYRSPFTLLSPLPARSATPES